MGVEMGVRQEEIQGEKRKGLREPGMGPGPRNRNRRESRMRMARDEE